jgi:glycerate 2-kinase
MEFRAPTSDSPQRQLRREAVEIFRHALVECSPERLLPARLRRKDNCLEGPGFRFPLGERRPLLFSYGKAAISMVQGLRGLLALDEMEAMAVVPPGVQPPAIPGATWILAAHPVPDRMSFRAGRALLKRAGECAQGDLLIHLISGGGSALLASPLRPLVGFAEKALIHRLLIGSGLGIREMNVVRKHFSAIKGGRLLLRAPGARQLSVILSDVPKAIPETVAGGPTLPDPVSAGECMRILAESGILAELPAPLRRRLKRRGPPELPRAQEPAFRTHVWTVLASGEDLVEAACSRASGLGYRVCRMKEPIEERVDQALDRIFLERARMGGDAERPLCIVAGGEARQIPSIRMGLGGRAQEMAAAAADRLRGIPDVLFLAAGSDGVDGNSPAAGAMADGETLSRAREIGLDPEALRREGNTFRLFEALMDAVETGPTGNNLRDLYLLLERPGAGRLTGGASAGRQAS